MIVSHRDNSQKKCRLHQLKIWLVIFYHTIAVAAQLSFANPNAVINKFTG